jgi:hypothetical protein
MFLYLFLKSDADHWVLKRQCPIVSFRKILYRYPHVYKKLDRETIRLIGGTSEGPDI